VITLLYKLRLLHPQVTKMRIAIRFASNVFQAAKVISRLEQSRNKLSIHSMRIFLNQNQNSINLNYCKSVLLEFYG